MRRPAPRPRVGRRRLTHWDSLVWPERLVNFRTK
jgi:hypothetical protein